MYVCSGWLYWKFGLCIVNTAVELGSVWGRRSGVLGCFSHFRRGNRVEIPGGEGGGSWDGIGGSIDLFWGRSNGSRLRCCDIEFLLLCHINKEGKITSDNVGTWAVASSRQGPFARWRRRARANFVGLGVEEPSGQPGSPSWAEPTP